MRARHRFEDWVLSVQPPPNLYWPKDEARRNRDGRLYKGAIVIGLVGMRNEALCGVCNLWLRGGLSNHNRGKRHLALYAAILERIEELRNISERSKLCAVPIVDERDEQSKQSKQQ